MPPHFVELATLVIFDLCGVIEFGNATDSKSHAFPLINLFVGQQNGDGI